VFVRDSDVLLSGKIDLPAVGREHAGQNMHQRAFACAVFTDQRMDLAAANFQIDAVERFDAGELLDDAAGIEQHVIQRGSVGLAHLAGQWKG
jgi:hypothetical protein